MSRGAIGRIRFWMMESDRWFLLIAALCLAIIAGVGIINYAQQERQIEAIQENRRIAVQVQGRMEEVAFWQKNVESRADLLTEQIAVERGRVDVLQDQVTEIFGR